jgi:hypothetical protein
MKAALSPSRRRTHRAAVAIAWLRACRPVERETLVSDEDQACWLTPGALLFSMAKREQATAPPVDEFVATAAHLVDHD